MSDRLSDLRTILADVRRRWARRALAVAWTLGAATAAALLLIGLLAVQLVAGDGIPLVIAVVAFLSLVAASLVCALLPLRQTPGDVQMARFVEERAGGLDDVLVTAVERGRESREPGTGNGAPDPMLELLAADALRAARGVDLDAIISRRVLSGALTGAALASVALLVAAGVFAPSAGRAGRVVGAYLFPASYVIDVRPGTTKVRAGQPLTISARIAGIAGELVPTLTVGTGHDARSSRMTTGTSPGEFMITLNNISESFPYRVSAGAVRSPDFTVSVIRPVRVSRIDLRFEYPKGLGLPPHTEPDSGDIYAPAGTKVQVIVTTDKPVARGQLAMADGSALPLAGTDRVLTAGLTVAADGSYRVALDDVDGLSSAGDTEYFIRMLEDRPPEVRILRPASDKQVSPLEEVAIEARAEDDFGVASLELVVTSSRGKETVTPLDGAGHGLTAGGTHTLFLEDLRVQPGDFVTYHARARDVGRGRRGSEARSDVYFLEVKPYEEEFVAADSQAMSMPGQQTGVEELAAAQKEIISATWKLDARARKVRDARSTQDIRAVGRAQTMLKAQAEEAARQLSRAAGDPRRRRGLQAGIAPGGDDPMARAVEAMGQAARELDRLRTADSLPHEMEALSQLLKMAADIRRRQVSRQQAQGGGSGNRQTLDLSTLFDQELRKKQQTNYETPSTTETPADERKAEDPLEHIRELARRQEALTRQQQDLARKQDQLAKDDVTRQLEKLAREQNELQQQAEQMSQQLRQQSQAGRDQQAQGAQGQQKASPSGQSGQGAQDASADGRKMREISEEMRQAATDLRRQDPRQASARGDRALQQLRTLEQQMQGARPDERRRALGDLQLEARQLADAERRLGNEAWRTAPGEAGEDARRRLAAEQERLADRTDRLGESARQLSKGAAEADEQQAVTEVARDIERQRLAGRMREAAQAMRQGSQPSGARASGPSDELARALDKVAERLGVATGLRDGETERLSQQLGRTQELRDRLNELQRDMDALAGADQTSDGAPSRQGSPQGQPPGRDGQQGQATRGSSSAAQPGAEGREGASGQQGGAAGGQSGEIARLQRDLNDRIRDTERLAQEVRKENPGMQTGASTPEQWSRSVSAPGTEGFKQDFAKWESLKKNLLVALELTEAQLSEQLRARENKERLNAGRREAVDESYRDLVDSYFRSLAAPRRPRP